MCCKSFINERKFVKKHFSYKNICTSKIYIWTRTFSINYNNLKCVCDIYEILVNPINIIFCHRKKERMICRLAYKVKQIYTIIFKFNLQHNKAAAVN